MLRRLVYLAAFAFVSALFLVAFALPEVRLGFASLVAAIVVGAWWIARRLPARSWSSSELRVSAVIAPVLGVSIALWIPSARAFCDCPMPRDAPAGFACNCTIDRHVVLRVCIALVGAGLYLALAAAARRRARTSSPAT
jgi:MFS superfamily sulfate permease-like transporter